MRVKIKITKVFVSTTALLIAGNAMASHSYSRAGYEVVAGPYAERPTAPSYSAVVPQPIFYAECEKTSGKWVGVFETSMGYIIEHDDLLVHVYHKSNPHLHTSATMLNFYKRDPFFNGCPPQSENGLLKVKTSLAEFVSQVNKFGEVISQQVINRHVPLLPLQSSEPEFTSSTPAPNYTTVRDYSSQRQAPARSTRDMDSDNGMWGGPSYEEKKRDMDSDNGMWG